jgi:hypothetical protein
MVVLSIEPAWSKKMAYALFQNKKLVYYDQRESLSELHISDVSIDFVIAEDPYLCENVRKYFVGKRVQTFKILCFAVGKIIYLAETLGAEYKLIRTVD